MLFWPADTVHDFPSPRLQTESTIYTSTSTVARWQTTTYGYGSRDLRSSFVAEHCTEPEIRVSSF
jgi:hypothetical protein